MFSVFQIKNSERVLNNIVAEIKNSYENRFSESDSIVIFHISGVAEKICFGFTRHNDDPFIMIS